jgi:hypothetical protein
MNPRDPNLRDFVHSIGVFTIDLSMVEWAVGHLIELYLGEAAAQAVMDAVPRNQERSKLLQKLVKKNEVDAGLKASILESLKAYEIHLENRNKLAHALAVTVDSDNQATWHGLKSKSHLPITASTTTVEELAEALKDLEALKAAMLHAGMFKAQEEGYQVLAGSIQIGPPAGPPLPKKFREVDPKKLEGSLVTLKKRKEKSIP